MRGKGRARIVLFATVGIDACVWLNGCATAGNANDETFTDGGVESSGAAMSGPHDGGGSSTTMSGDEPAEASAETATDDGSSAPDGAPDSGPDVVTGGDDEESSTDDSGGIGPLADASDGAAYEEYPEASPASADASEDATVVDSSIIDAGGGAETGSGGGPEDATLEATSPIDAAAPIDATSAVDAAPDVASTPPGDGAVDAACGGCKSGFSCASSGYCVSSTGVPAFGHVYVIVMEEQSLSTIQGSASAPYVNSLIAEYALAANYLAPDHPSLPNYLELTSGSAQGVQCDCAPGGSASCTLATCNLLANTCNCPVSASNLGDELESASLDWREYAEGMGSPCNLAGVDGGANFAASHVPFLYYDDVYTTPGRCATHVRDYGDFAADLSAGTYAFGMISPNTCHDMEVTLCTTNPVLQGDDWLSINVPPILATAGFAAGGHDALFIVWEEAGTDVGTPPAPLLVVSPLARATSTTAAYGPYSLLATIEDGLGVARLGSSATAAPIADVWK